MVPIGLPLSSEAAVNRPINLQYLGLWKRVLPLLALHHNGLPGPALTFQNLAHVTKLIN